MTSIESHPEQYWAAAGRPGPVPLALGPVHPGGPTLIDLLMALFGLSTNADLGGANADIEGDDTDRRAHAADAARKFSANEANAAEQMQGVGAQGMAHGGDQAECLSDTHGLAQNREAALGGEVVEGLLHHRPYVLVDRVDIRVLAELLGEVDRV